MSSTQQQQSQQLVDSFLEQALSSDKRSALELELLTFVTTHAEWHRPVALVTSGGTTVDLEVNSVRCLDNFSTGLRGAISVEQFLQRGYAVIHLWRTGSASPYARVLTQDLLGLEQANHGLSTASLGKLFSTQENDDEEDLMVQQVLQQEQAAMDPWLTNPTKSNTTTTVNNNAIESNATNDLEPSPVTLHRQVLHSTKLQTALAARKCAIQEQRLLTIPFRTIEEYLAKLQLIAQTLRHSQTLALCYMAAAVSDYYVPYEEKSLHKIQSHSTTKTTTAAAGEEDDNASEGLTLQLKSVPKTLGLLKTQWAPEAFLVSFKLETDMSILRQKATSAAQKYGCHLVIGNLLHTRHSKVWILSPPTTTPTVEEEAASNPPEDWTFQEISKSQGDDSLESAMIDYVVQCHFEYISNHGYSTHNNNSSRSLQAAKQRHEALLEQKRQRQRQALIQQIKGHAWTIAGTLIAFGLSSAINSALQSRARRR